MKDILDRHAERLAPGERHAVWQTISGERTREGRTSVRWVPAAVVGAVVALAVVVIAVARREPAAIRPVAPAKPVAAAPQDERRDVRRIATSPPAISRRLAAVPRGGRHGAVRAASAPRLLPAPDTALALVPPHAALRSGGAPAPVSGRAGTIAGRVTARGQAIPYANVRTLATRQGAQADEQGNFRIVGVPEGRVEIEASALGYDRVKQTVPVRTGETSSVDFEMGEAKVTKQFAEVEVGAAKRIDTKSSSTLQTITAERLTEIPVDNLSGAAAVKAGAAARGGEQHFRGGRGGESRFPFDGVTVAPPTPPVVPTTGGSRLPNDEPFDSMFFKHYGVNPFVATDEDPLSTFAVDVDAASYTLTRRYLALGHVPPAEAVRVEEFVNFFPQDYPRFADQDFRILADGAPSPFGPGYQLLRIGIKGREIAQRQRKPARLTFVIDVSGSMGREDRLELVKRALRVLVDRLRGDDRVGIVVYGTVGRVLVEPVALGGESAPPLGLHAGWGESDEDAPRATGDGRRLILDAMAQLRPEGSTNAADGLRLGYAMARRDYLPGAINRIVLCSDGVANEGVTGPESILAEVRSAADRGIHLTTIGFGMGNYNDVLMEQLADKGDGNHYYVDDLDEARRVFEEHLAGTLQTIAKDAKVQVEFDSTRVLRYRLLGFENRDVADRDFRNDRVDAGEIGAGHEVTALYEVKLAPGAVRGPLATVRLRYARPEQDGAGAPQVREIERRFDVSVLERRFEDAAPRFRLDAAAAEFAEILRGSYWAKEGRLSDVLPVARAAANDLRDAPSAELVRLLEKAAALKESPRP